MTRYQKKTNYREKYPDLSDEIIEVLEKSDRKMEYQQYDLKTEKYIIDNVRGAVKIYPSREDSYERLLEENRQFAIEVESVEDTAIKAAMIEKMLNCLKMLNKEEQELIIELYFKYKSERQLSAETGIHYMTIHNRKNRILDKLKKLMEN